LWTIDQLFGYHLRLHLSTDVGGGDGLRYDGLHIIPVMMEAEMVSETLDFYPQLTQLVAQEDFMEFSRRESFNSYIFLNS
jgi:hypothetical protein